jgi:hypothetical protein
MAALQGSLPFSADRFGPFQNKDIPDSHGKDGFSAVRASSQPSFNSGKSNETADSRSSAADGQSPKKQVSDKMADLFSDTNLKGLPVFAAPVSFSDFTEEMSKNSKTSGIEEVIDKIVESIKMLKSKDKTELVIDLKPEWMGNITLNIKSENGALTINILASQSTKDLLDSNLAELEAALKNSNLNVGNLGVSVDNNRKDNFSGKPDEDISWEPYISGNPISSPAEQVFKPTDGFSLEKALGWGTIEKNIYSQI